MTNMNWRYWLLAALLISFIPHIERLPWWFNALLALVILWRIPAVEQRLPLPNTWVKALMLAIGLVGIKKSYNTIFGPEAGTAFLLLCVLLKVLEVKADRDNYIVLTVALFVLASNFLFGKGLAVSVYAILGVFIIIAAYVGITNTTMKTTLAFRKAGILLAQALPLMIVLYVFFPRLPPLWTMKLTQGSAKTGMSDSMSPGDIASLSQSNELAFRVEFENNQIPPQSELYWRGLTFSEFDGQTWRPSQSAQFNEAAVAWSGMQLPLWVNSQIQINQQNTLRYKVILEPTDQKWLYSLIVPYSSTSDVGLTKDFRLVHDRPIFERFQYQAIRLSPVMLDPQLPKWLLAENLALPEEGNPIAHAMATKWRQYYGSDEAYVNALLRWFRTSNFFYTLEPPPLGANRIDDFLFRTKKGFCEHYSSAFTFLVRAAGIPARVVVGYQGGMLSPTGDSWQVRQLDAHAWAEVWLPQRGWVSLDPTGAVAPERIEKGMNNVANNQAVWGDTPLSVIKYNNYKWLSQLRNMADYLNYRWQKDIIGYDSEQQEAFLYRLLGDNNLWKRLGIMFAVLLFIVAGLAFWTIYRARKIIHPADKAIIMLSRKLEKRGLARQYGEGVLAYLQRLNEAQPHWQEVTTLLLAQYTAIRYQPQHVASYKIREMDYLVRNWPAYRPKKTQLL
ncbi:transglutaminase TgpA family protein [Agitococcus lubricus]|uniref:Transglutaminase superfamily protein n=1 Tax=Agitococcus lubricus TaxID=1077255 RepID=A0A2T5IWZ8_9GAMM|nr:DUF3488 and transglutaminase-like domain-containing protein [Agitococcus lubricus]PTQ88459.1 transglutaminase superfamily protein [Agitococcus lubricus]